MFVFTAFIEEDRSGQSYGEEETTGLQAQIQDRCKSLNPSSE